MDFSCQRPRDLSARVYNSVVSLNIFFFYIIGENRPATLGFCIFQVTDKKKIISKGDVDDLHALPSL